MSLFSSLILDPVARQARRFSGVRSVDESNQEAQPLACDGLDSTSTSPGPPPSLLVESRDASLIEQTQVSVPNSQRSRNAALDDQESDDDVPSNATSTTPRNLPFDTSSDPSHHLVDRLRRTNLESSLLSAPMTPSLQPPIPRPVNQHASAMSDPLPSDDGMAYLRTRIHAIRDLNVTDQVRARMIHDLMTEQYHSMRPTSPSSFVSHDRPLTPTDGGSIFSDVQPSSPYSSTSDMNPENPYDLREGDTEPTYQPNTERAGDHVEDDEEEIADGEKVLGCQHYKRNVKVQCFECRRWYTCRHCHDAVEDHNLNRKKTQHMLCMACGSPQRASDHCRVCETVAACYYCDICKLWDNSSKKIYHCPDCGICRKGEGIGKDFYHCKSCNVCISISHATSHKCLPHATESNCPICGDYLFTSSIPVVSMPCGHYLHKGCYNLYMQTAYKCPLCAKSAVNMDLQWRKLTQAIESQPMPETFANTRAVVKCNDCSAKSSVKYHWLGNQCGSCDSYNTNELRILGGTESEQAADALLDADAELASSPLASPGSPSQIPLRSPRYYFTPDKPEETWLPGQLPSFPFQMPRRPRMPQFPSLPQLPPLPNFPQIPQFPQMPQLPQMPDAAQQIMERFRRSFDSYLNPSGGVAIENVPFIDLSSDDRGERRATDGTTVKEPSLPQYVLERFTSSLARFRNDLIPTTEEIPALDLSEDHDPEGLQFWSHFGGHWDRFVARSNDEESEESSSDESEHEEEGDDEDDEEHDVSSCSMELDLPGHR